MIFLIIIARKETEFRSTIIIGAYLNLSLVPFSSKMADEGTFSNLKYFYLIRYVKASFRVKYLYFL